MSEKTKEKLKISEKIDKFFKKAVNFLYPQDIKCIFCGDELKEDSPYHICENCKKTLPYNNKKICKLCGVKIIDLSEVCYFCFKEIVPYKVARAPFCYEGPIRKVVNNFKFNNAKFLFEPLSKFMVDEYKKNKFNCDIIIPVPISEKRLLERSYNQSEMLAKEISKQLNLPLINNAVIKVKDTPKQARLNYHLRQKNLQDAFKVIDKKALKGKNLLLIDDVITTGATVKSICSEINKSRPKSITILTLAHTEYKRKKAKTNIKYLVAKNIKTVKFYKNIKKNHKKLLKMLKR